MKVPALTCASGSSGNRSAAREYSRSAFGPSPTAAYAEASLRRAWPNFGSTWTALRYSMIASGNCCCATYLSPLATLASLRVFGSPAHAAKESEKRIAGGTNQIEPLRIMPTQTQELSHPGGG